mgnify:CR=1 FL=1
MPNTKIMTFISYENLFSHIEKNGLLIPSSYLKNDENIDSLVNYFIENFDSIEGISYSSFLNAIVQSHKAEETQKIGWNELKHCKLVNSDNNAGIVFHRDNLLYMISQLIKKEKFGDVKITGQKTFNSAADYYKSLLLISSQGAFNPPESQSEQSVLRDYFLRAYPYYYLPDIVETIFELRFQRYWYIYDDLIKKLDNGKVGKVKEGVELIAKEFNLSLKDYFHVLTGIFTWFLIAPNAKRKNPENDDLKKIGFEPKNIESYYIKKQNFGENSDLFKLVKQLSHSLNDFKQKLQATRKDLINGFYKDFQAFFDYPVFRIDDDNYCIIDLKFLFEGLCAGFMWRINEISPQNLQGIKEQYGYLLEEYFVELLKKIYGEQKITRPTESGKPDAILETDSHILIFEFTVEYYRFASLYSEGTESFQQDVYRLLFNEGKHDLNSRGKKDKGKFHKLNNYLEEHKNSQKTVIPILVTENYFGDYEMLDRFNSQLSENVVSKNLDNIKQNRPLIINLDDIEIFWRVSNSEKAADQFIDLVEKWRKLQDKGPYHFNFSYFVSETHKQEDVKNNSKDFFSWKNFIEKLSNATT